MIGVEEARNLVLQTITPTPVETTTLERSAGRYAASSLIAPYDHPLFDNSAVDGYAFAFDQGSGPWKVIGDIAAGGVMKRALDKGQCARIFTGAMMPSGADTVVMQEFVTRTDGSIVHTDSKLIRGTNVRRKGEQLKSGIAVLEKGDRLSPQALGLLASVGISELKVHTLPRITTIITGGEFTDGGPLPGRIFSSNDVMLSAALAQMHIRPIIMRSPDDASTLERTLRQALLQSDLVITTGGVSVGDHDLVAETMERLGVETIFHKVAQKPGKPMLFGRRSRTLVFGLPGNPRAVMILFWEYVLPAIRAMLGATKPELRTEKLPLAESISLKGERDEFRAAVIRSGKVELLMDEGSHMLASLIQAEVLAWFPANVNAYNSGDPVEVHHIPER